MTADEWNAKHRIGTGVRYFPVLGRSEWRFHTTQSHAFDANGIACIFLVGQAGYVRLDHCDPIARPVTTMVLTPQGPVRVVLRGDYFLIRVGRMYYAGRSLEVAIARMLARREDQCGSVPAVDIATTLSRNIRELRARLGLTQSEFAQRVRSSRVQVARWETGKAWPRPASLYCMAREAGVTVDQLTGRQPLLAQAVDLPEVQ